MPRKTSITTDFPLGDVKGEMKKEDAIEATFLSRYGNKFCKTQPMFMSRTRFLKLLKESGAKPEWQEWGDKTDSHGNIVKDDGKTVKEWQNVDHSYVFKGEQRAIE